MEGPSGSTRLVLFCALAGPLTMALNGVYLLLPRPPPKIINGSAVIGSAGSEQARRQACDKHAGPTSELPHRRLQGEGVQARLAPTGRARAISHSGRHCCSCCLLYFTVLYCPVLYLLLLESSYDALSTDEL